MLWLSPAPFWFCFADILQGVLSDLFIYFNLSLTLISLRIKKNCNPFSSKLTNFKQVYWASGELKNGKFENIPEDVQSFYSYTVISNNDEGYFTFTTQHDEYSTWSLSYNGQLCTGQAGEIVIIASGSQCYGYNSNGGCKLRDQPICRQESGRFFESMDVRVPEQVMSYDLDYNVALNKTAGWNNCDCWIHHFI